MVAAVLARARSVPAALVVIVLAAAYAALWGAGLAASHRNPTLDSAEQLVWSYALEPGYWKHPPLPSWIMHALVQVFGASSALTFHATQACVAIALVLLWRLGCEFMAPERSLAAAALTTLVAYHGFGADAFNHNSVMLPFQAAMTLCFYLATRRRSWIWWPLAGAAAGLSLMVKYVAVFPIAALLVAFAADRRLHERRQFAGLALAAAVAALVFAPHAWWVVAGGFQTLHYMHSVATPVRGLLEAITNPVQFLLGQLLRMLPLLLALAWLLRRGPAQQAQGMAGRDRLFLWIAGAGPLALVLAYATVTGTQLQARWGTPLLLLSGWLALDLVRRRVAPALGETLRTVVVLQGALWLVVAVLAPGVRDTLDLRGRARFPAGALAAAAETTWRAETGRPLHFVVSDIWLGGNLVAQAGRPLPVLVDGDAQRAPWVDPQQLARCGALVMQDAASPPEPGVARALSLATRRGEWQLPWTAGDVEPSRIAWGILPATDGASCAE